MNGSPKQTANPRKMGKLGLSQSRKLGTLTMWWGAVDCYETLEVWAMRGVATILASRMAWHLVALALVSPLFAPVRCSGRCSERVCGCCLGEQTHSTGPPQCCARRTQTPARPMRGRADDVRWRGKSQPNQPCHCNCRDCLCDWDDETPTWSFTRNDRRPSYAGRPSGPPHNISLLRGWRYFLCRQSATGVLGGPQSSPDRCVLLCTFLL